MESAFLICDECVSGTRGRYSAPNERRRRFRSWGSGRRRCTGITLGLPSMMSRTAAGAVVARAKAATLGRAAAHAGRVLKGRCRLHDEQRPLQQSAVGVRLVAGGGWSAESSSSQLAKARQEALLVLPGFNAGSQTAVLRVEMWAPVEDRLGHEAEFLYCRLGTSLLWASCWWITKVGRWRRAIV